MSNSKGDWLGILHHVYTEENMNAGGYPMLKPKMIQEIQDLKLRGYSLNEILRYYQDNCRKPPSLPTIRKYYNMEVIPHNPKQSLQKDKIFDHEPLSSAIIEILRNNSGKKYCISSVYDVLEERFIENGSMEALPGNQQTLRNYVRYLRENGVVEDTPENRRIYDHVFDTPPGEQMILDFGEERLAPGFRVHFICLLMRYSRKFCVFAQDHKFNAEEACRAIYRAFAKLGGRPWVLVIDQDAVFISSETYGEVIKTRVFGDFCAEQELRLWVCNKADPESKGPVENLVGFVKKSFLSARNFTCIDDVLKSLPGWVERKNRRIHQATFRVPVDVFDDVEKDALQPMLPSAYENSPSSFTGIDIGSMPYIQYKSSKYSVPREFCFSRLLYKAIDGKLHVYDDAMKHICTHLISECRGSVIRLDEHRKEESTDWLVTVERLRRKWDNFSFQAFVNGLRKENPRHIRKQLSAVERFLDAEKPPRPLVSDVMGQCCQESCFRYSRFESIYHLAKAGRFSREQVASDSVQHQDMEFYGKAFANRCEG